MRKMSDELFEEDFSSTWHSSNENQEYKRNLNRFDDVQREIASNKQQSSDNKAKDPSKLKFKKDSIKLVGLGALPPKVYVCKRLKICKGDLISLCAAGGSGKSMLLQYVAVCAATSGKLFGSFDITARRILHIDQEQGLRLTQSRYERLAKGMGQDSAEMQIDRVNLEERLDSDVENMAEIENQVVELFSGYDLVMIDSLKKVSCADENSSQIELVLNLLKRAAERADTAVIIIHHKGKGKVEGRQSGRGHSSIYDSVDVQLDLDHEQGTSEYVISCAKVRDGHFINSISYELSDAGSWNEDQDCFDEIQIKMLSENHIDLTTEHSIIAAIEKNGTMNNSELFNVIGGNREKFNSELERLVFSQTLVMNKGPRNASLYSLAKKGQ